MDIQFLTNEKGEKTAVQIPIEQWEQILDELEMREDILAYDQAKSEEQTFQPLEEVIKEIEQERIPKVKQ